MSVADEFRARPPAAAAVLEQMTETAFLGHVIRSLRERGYRVHHCRPSRRADGRWNTAIQGDAGFPDICAAGNGRLLLLELKARGGQPTEEQTLWIGAVPWGHRSVVARVLWPETWGAFLAALDGGNI